MENSTDSVPIWEWCFRTIVFPTLTALYCVILYTFYSNGKVFKNSYYKFIAALAICDLIQSFYLLFVVYLSDVLGYVYLNKYVGHFLECIVTGLGWYSNLYMNLFTASNRFCAIVFYTKYKIWYTDKISRIMICVAFLFGMSSQFPFVLVCDVITDFNITFTLYSFSSLDKCPSLVIMYSYIDTFLSLIICLLLLVAYLTAFGFSLKRLKHCSKSYIKELKLMLQGLIIVVMLTVCEITLWTADFHSLSLFIYSFYCCFNPLLYLSLDRRLRHHVKKMFYCWHKNMRHPKAPSEVITMTGT